MFTLQSRHVCVREAVRHNVKGISEIFLPALATTYKTAYYNNFITKTQPYKSN